MRVEEHTIEVAGSPVFFRRAPVERELTPVLLHDVPTSSDDVEPLLARIGGLAPDLQGFGRSGKGGHLDPTLPGIAAALGALLDALAVDRVRLIGHGWGAAVALELARARPDRVERLTLVSPVALLEGHRYGRVERALRTPVLGELLMGATTRAVLARRLRAGTTTGHAFPRERIAALYEQFDQGTQRATLRLLRATAPDHCARDRPEHPTRIIRGAEDPWLDADAANRFGAPVTTLEGAGHWPWLDRPETVDLITA